MLNILKIDTKLKYLLLEVVYIYCMKYPARQRFIESFSPGLHPCSWQQYVCFGHGQQYNNIWKVEDVKIQ